jgi:uncharacterized membrane protein
VRIALILITLAYPVLVYLGIGRLEPRWLALLLAALALMRAWASKERYWLVAAAGALLLAIAGMAGNSLLPLKLYPVLVNVVLFTVFAASLFSPMSAIERVARLREPDLPPQGVAYTRRVTQAWCGFFVFNGSMAYVTAYWGSDADWALYNGLIAYLLIGLLSGAEWLVRRRVLSRMTHG